jgi:Flp pilus assembly pilin Flp
MNFIASKLRAALRNESGAVTVDWVVLTAAVVILSIGAIAALDGGIAGLIGGINAELTFDNIESQADGGT